MRLPFWRRKQYEDLEEELRSHLRMDAQERMDDGEAPSSAEHAARREFGNLLLVEEVTRDTSGWLWLERLVRDIHYGLRMMAKSPAFTVIAVLTLALGIGANTAVFSLVNTLLLRPFYPEIHRLIVLQSVPASMRGRTQTAKMSYPVYLAWKQHHDIFESVAAMYGQGPSLTGLGEPERLQAALVSSDFLPQLGIAPSIGRSFRPEDEPRSAPPVVLLSYRFWRTRFNSDPAVVGRTVNLDDRAFTIIGVLPEDAALGRSLFKGSSATSFDVIEPLRPDLDAMTAGFNNMVVIARLRPGLALPAAISAIDSQTAAVNAQFGSQNKVQVIPLQNYLIGDSRSLMLILLGAVAAVLLITCANTANVLLARGAARDKEIAIRLALGASRMRLFSQLLTESLVMSLFGGVLALIFLWATREGLTNLLATRLPNGVIIHLDGAILLFTLTLSLLTGILFGVIPALQSPGQNLRDRLSRLGRTSAISGSQRVRNTLVVAEIACSLALLAGAGLLLRSFVRLLNVDKGFASDHLLTLRFWPAPARYSEPRVETAYLNAIVQRARQLPAVQAVALSSNLPLGGNMTSGDFHIQGRPFDPNDVIMGSKMLVGGDYFSAMRIPLVAGRVFTDRDNTAGAPPVVVLDQSFARRYFAGENPIGKHLNFGWGGSAWCEIVGVVAPVKESALAGDAQPTVYTPLAQRPPLLTYQLFYLSVRSSGDPAMQAVAVKNVIRGLDALQIIEHVRTMDDLVMESAASSRAPLWLFGAFAAIALLLAAIGIYGVLSYYVLQRRQEIGTRLALGAQRSDVFRLVLGHAAQLILAGLVLGLLIALGSNRIVASLLFGTRPTDLPTLAAVSAVLAAVALLACAVPVFRATTVDPQIVLRNE